MMLGKFYRSFIFSSENDEIQSVSVLDIFRSAPNTNEMRSSTSAKKNTTKRDAKPESTDADADQRALLEQAIQKREKLAESKLELAKVFITNKMVDIARRRLREIASEFDGSRVATEATALLTAIAADRKTAPKK